MTYRNDEKGGETPAAISVEEQYHLLMDCVTDFAIFLLDPQARVAS